MARTTINLRPWKVPNFVIEAGSPDREVPLGKWSIEEMEADTLSDMCDEFRREVFRKAGKRDPRSTPAEKELRRMMGQ